MTIGWLLDTQQPLKLMPYLICRQYSIPRILDTEANEAQKKLGDPSVQLSSQNFGLILDTSEEDWDSFEFQARNYRIDGKSQSTLCEENSQVRIPYCDLTSAY